MRSLGRLLSALSASAAVLLVLAGVPAALWFLAQPVLASDRWSVLPDVGSMIMRPDDGTVLVAFLLLVATGVWSVLALSILAELVAVLTSRPTRRIDLPGFRLGRTVAAALVATMLGAGPAMAAVPAAMVVSVSSPTTQPREAPESGPVHVVAPRDTLWQIAETTLGDPLRWREIFDLNVGRPQADGTPLTEAATLEVGWTLVLPADAHDVVRVEPGDTLTELAAAHLGDANRASELFETNRATIVDPDLLRPGWLLTLPTGSNHDDPIDVEAAPPPVVPDRTPAPEPPATSPAPSPRTDRVHTSVTKSEPEAAAPVAVAAMSAIVLAGVVTAVRVRRRRQMRFRPARHRIPVPADDAGRMEWLAFAEPADMTSALLDAALRSLTLHDWTGLATPSLRTIEIDGERAVLTLAEPAVLRPPFVRVDNDTWELDPNSALPVPIDEAAGYCAPFPTLVSVATDSERTLLVDLEQHAVTRIDGDQDRASALLRHIAAELATARWAEDVEVLLVGLGVELVALEPERLRAVRTLREALDEVALRSATAQDAIARMALNSVTEGRLRDVAADSWLPLVVIADVKPDDDDRRRLEELPPSAVAVVVPDDGDYGVELHIDADGRFGARHLAGGPWQAAGLSETLGAQLATVLGTTSLPAEPVRAAPESEPWAAEMDEDGSLQDVPQQPDATPVERDAKAVRRLGIVEHQDPRLDDDLVAWEDRSQAPVVPMIAILGEPQVRAPGPVPQARPSWFVEVLVYLSLHPAGVTSEKALTDLWPDGRRISAATVRHAFYGARRWAGRGLGGNVAVAFVSDMQTDSTYRLRGHLLDWDLFRRLRKRGQARFAAGHPGAVDDYEVALSLIRGSVLSALRPGGYAWLNNHDQRHDLQIPGFIVDAAHELVDIALADGDTTRARRAAECARSVDVDVAFDQPLTDLMRIADAEENRAELELYAALLLDARGFEVPEELAPESFAVLNELLPAGPRRRSP